jgi:membrane protein DedA with SNARE-associated domain
MDQAFDFLLRHGYLVVFALVLAEQIGLPLPALPILLAIGALSGEGRYSAWLALAVAVAASLLADLFWYGLGRRRGHAILKLLCRISLEPDSCVRRTEQVFARHGARTLLYAKLVPGLNTAAPPLAGLLGMPLRRFLLYDAAGAALWAGPFIGLGRAFDDQLMGILALAEGASTAAGATVLGLLLLYIAIKFWQRQRFLRQLRTARITPEELARKLEAREEVVIVDLRHDLDFAADAVVIPGALRIAPEDIESRHAEIPRGREIVLYCT